MIELPGSLERATLGDVLGALHRDRVSGALCLSELGREGYQHVIHWHEGLIHHIESTRPPGPRRAWTMSVGAEHAASWMLADGAEHERLARLEALFQLTRARISFRVMGRRAPPSARPLGPAEFLHGRRRKRDSAPPRPLEPQTPRLLALRTLGLSGNPDREAVRAAFRRLAREWHPDRHACSDAQTRAASSRRFVEISSAYRELMAESA